MNPPVSNPCAWSSPARSWIRSVVDAMARGDILQLVVFSTFFGIALGAIGARGQPVLHVLAGESAGQREPSPGAAVERVTRRHVDLVENRRPRGIARQRSRLSRIC